MIPSLKPGAKLLKVDGPTIETARLILRPWRISDIAANTAMLSEPGTARFIPTTAAEIAGNERMLRKVFGYPKAKPTQPAKPAAAPAAATAVPVKK